MQQLPLKQKVAAMLRCLQKAGLVPSPAPCAVGPMLTRIVEAAGDRLKVFGDILAYADFFFRQSVEYDEKAFEKNLRKPGAAQLLAAFRERLAGLDDFGVAALEAALTGFVAEQGVKIGDIIHALRVATTGKSVGPGVYDCLAILGKSVVLERIDRALERAQTPAP